MQCVILAGGLGTRMRPLTDTCPKTLLPVRGRPFAYYQLHWLASQGITEVVYCDRPSRRHDPAILGPGTCAGSTRCVMSMKASGCAGPAARCVWRANRACLKTAFW